MDSMSVPLFDYKKLQSLAEVGRDQFQTNKPFQHIVFDRFALPELLDAALEQFPGPKDIKWWSYKNPLEVKLAQNSLDLLPPIFRRILWEFNAGPFVRFLESLTGIEGLISDPDFVGGGLHQIERGGKLDVHLDFSVHKKLGLNRRLNVILYLNKGWEEEYGGQLELWDKEMKGPPIKVLPVFDRCVIFNTNDDSPHGHPDPLTCPSDWTRKSLALYYYTAPRVEEGMRVEHSTTYMARPQDDRSLDELRARRAKGRIEDSTT